MTVNLALASPVKTTVLPSKFCPKLPLAVLLVGKT